MPRSIKTLVPLVEVPGHGRIEAAQTTIILTDDEYSDIQPEAFSTNKLQDLGPTGPMSVQANFVTNAAALTAPATFNATTYTASELNALRTDVAALQAKINAILAALRVNGGPMKAS